LTVKDYRYSGYYRLERLAGSGVGAPLHQSGCANFLLQQRGPK